MPRHKSGLTLQGPVHTEVTNNCVVVISLLCDAVIGLVEGGSSHMPSGETLEELWMECVT